MPRQPLRCHGQIRSRLGDGDWRVSFREGGAFAMLGLITSDENGRYQGIGVSQPLDDVVQPSFQEAADALRPRPADVPGILAGVRT